MMREAVVVASSRTPLAKSFRGSFNMTRPDDLAAHCIQDVLKPRGVGVVIEGVHQCMTTRGIHKHGVSMITSQLLGHFRSDPRTRAEFLTMIGRPGSPG